MQGEFGEGEHLYMFMVPSLPSFPLVALFHLSGSRFSLFLFLTPPRVVPNVWHFPYFVGATSTNSLMIKLQPKIYDHIMLTVRISFIPSVCSQVPVIVLCLPEPRGLSVETSTNNRRFLMVFPLLTAALSTPPDICQILACCFLISLIELAIFVASIVQVREEGWTNEEELNMLSGVKRATTNQIFPHWKGFGVLCLLFPKSSASPIYNTLYILFSVD